MVAADAACRGPQSQSRSANCFGSRPSVQAAWHAFEPWSWHNIQLTGSLAVEQPGNAKHLNQKQGDAPFSPRCQSEIQYQYGRFRAQRATIPLTATPKVWSLQPSSALGSTSSGHALITDSQTGQDYHFCNGTNCIVICESDCNTSLTYLQQFIRSYNDPIQFLKVALKAI